MNYLLLGLTLVAVIIDLRWRKIPNWLTFGGVLVALAYQVFLGAGLVFFLKGFALGLVLFFLLFAVGWLGAGDVKLLAMIGAFVGAEKILWVGLWAAIAGGVLSLAWLFNNKNRKEVGNFLSNTAYSLVNKTPLPAPGKNQNSRIMPYSLAIVVGLLIVLFKS